MYAGKSLLVIIPARGGSKGIPKKNIVLLNGKPLISYSIEAALNSKYVDYVMVSTDDQEIASVSERYDARVPFLRPSQYATDTSKTIDAVLHSVEELNRIGKNFDVLVLLQATQPLRTGDDVDRAIELFFEEGMSSLVSVCEVEDNPVLMRRIINGKLSNLIENNSTIRRQDMPKYYKVNGCIYINRISDLDANTSFNDNIIPFIMEKSHSVDIDELKDIALAEYYLKQYNRENR